MALANDQALGTNVFVATATTVALTTTATVASGGFIVLTVGWFSATTTLSSVAGGSLTWTVQRQRKSGGGANIAVCWAQAPSGLASGSSLTATFSATSPGRAIHARSFTGVETSTPVETSGDAILGSGTAWNTGAITTTVTPDCLVWGASMGDGVDTTSAPAATYTESADWNTASGGDTYTAVYRIVTATGAYTPAGTWASSQGQSANVAVAFRAAAGGGGVPVKSLAALGVG